MPSFGPISIDYPLINGTRFEYASIEIKAAGKRYVGVKSIDYSQDLEPGQVYGTHAQKIGRTRGELKPDGSMEMYKEEATNLIVGLGPGYMEVVFDIVVNYSEGLNIVTDTIKGCRIKKVSDSHSQGTDAITTKLDLDVMSILFNGIKPMKDMLNGII